VYARVPAACRVLWHAALADAIEAGELPGEAVTHRLRAAVDPASCAAAVAACRTAAAQAEGALAFDRVVELLDAARRLPGVDRGTRADLELSAAAAEFAAGRAETAVRRCRRVAAEGATADQLVRAALTVRGLGGPLNAELVLLCDAALAALPEHDLAGRARVLAQRALAAWESAGWAAAVDAPSAEALRLAERSGSPVALADALRARQHAVSDVEGVTERVELARRMIALARGGGPADAELWGRLWRIDAALQLGEIDVVVDELAQLAVLAERLGWPIAWWHQHRMTAARLLLAGRFTDAEAAADRADAEARRTEDITALAIGGALRGELLRLTGRYGEAVERLRAAREGVRLRGGCRSSSPPRADLRRGGRDGRGAPDARRAARPAAAPAPATAGGSPRSRARACSRRSSRTSRRSRGASTSSGRTAGTTSRAGRARCAATGRSAA
jgi:hypothetical protein